MLEGNLNRVRQDGVRIRLGRGGGGSERTFGAPRPVLNPGLRQRDMSFSAKTVRVVNTEVEH